MSIKVLLADDHRALRDGLSLVIGRQTDMSVVGEAGTGRETLAEVLKLAPDLVVMDMRMPDLDGIELARRLLAKAPDTRIVMLTALSDPLLVDQALLAGVSGYLLKSNGADDLVRAIREVMGGKIFLCTEVATPVVARYRKQLESRAAPGHPLLSDRERDVLKLTAQGFRAKEIADHLHIGVRTVETYRARLMKKLACESNVELTRYAIREGMVSV